MTMPLEGIRVLDWTVFQLGPVASMMLADLGAEVIKIEDKALGGDPARGMVKLLGTMAGLAGRNAYFEHNNRGKKSIVVDLRKEKGQETIYRLVEKSDVFVQNHRLGVAERIAMDYETLSQYNPRLIYAYANGWGTRGPDAQDPAFDYTGLARSGIMTVTGEPDMPPLIIQGGIGDQVGAIMTAYGIMTALFVRERLGIGQMVNTSLLSSLIFQQGLNISFHLLMGKEMAKHTRAKAGNPLWNHYKCKGDKWIALAHLQPDRFWGNVCKALGIENLEKDPRFENFEVRGGNSAELISIMDDVFATKTREEWLKVFKEKGVIASSVNTISELASDPQVLANDYILDFDHPVWGKVKAVGIPVEFSKTPGEVRREAPEFGQHTEEVLMDVLGYTWEDIGKLKEEEVI